MSSDTVVNPLSPKYAEEQIFISYNFVNILVPIEPILTATWTSTVKTGTDASAATMIEGVADISKDPIVTQKVKAGVKGNTYEIKCVITTASRVLAHSEILVIK
jgi:hypothetical protein